MYEDNSNLAVNVMNGDVDIVWGIISNPLDFAFQNFMYNVVVHKCSQKSMNLQWYNNLAPELVPFLKVKKCIKAY